MKRFISLTISLIMILCSTICVDICSYATENDVEMVVASSLQTGDRFQLGNYPQSRVIEKELIENLSSIACDMIDYGYICNSSSWNHSYSRIDMKYADISYNGSLYRKVYIGQYRPYWTNTSPSSSSTYQYENGYEIGNTYYFKWEPIIWQVLAKENDGVYVMSESIVDAQPYNNFLENTTWENCSLRNWLNDNFYNSAFSFDEQEKINSITHANENSYFYGTSGGNSTTDRLWILSYGDSINSDYGFSNSYLDYNSARQAYGSDYAVSQGLWVSQHGSDVGKSDWYLRTPGNGQRNVTNVRSYGDIRINYDTVVNVHEGIRPACKISLSALVNVNIISYGNLYLEKESLSNYISFNPKWFSNNSYIHELATFCSLMNLQSYEDENKTRQTLQELGFSDEKTICDLCSETGKDRRNRNDYIISSREIVLSKKKYNLVLVICVGTRENEQWNSNFDPYGLDTDHFSSKSPNHVGFNDAKNYVYSALINYLGDNYTKENTKIVLTGHSRGAAAANLMAAQMIDNYEKNSNSAIVKPENLFTYTFASPNPTRDTNRKNPKYNRIYNIVNPQDFVTKVMLQSWGYGRYGTTYSLPTKTNDYNYDIYKLNMLKYFKEMQQANGESQNYSDYESGEDEVYNLVRTMSINVKNLDEYYTKYDYFFASQKVTPFAYFQDALCPMVNGGDMITAGAYLAKSATSNSLFGTVSRFFISKGNGVLKNNFQHAHSMATYSAYMLSLNSNNIKFRKGHKGTVNCPVDVEIYDNSTGELVGQITNNKVNEELLEKEHSVVMTVDGDEKSFWLPSNGNYRVVLTGNDEGNMDYILSKVDSDTGELERTNYYNVPLKNGESYTSEVEAESELQEVTVETENAEVVEPDEHFSTENMQSYAVNTFVEGSGYAPETINIDSGDYITLEATPICSDFIGWYDTDDNLVSNETEYRFRPTKDTNIVAKYSEAIYHKFEKTDVESTCQNNGYSEYKCIVCEYSYKDEFKEKTSHDYIYCDVNEKSYIEYNCRNCNYITEYNPDDLIKDWNNDYVNIVPSNNQNDISCYLDVVPDGIINAKDYAKLNHIKKFGY